MWPDARGELCRRMPRSWAAAIVMHGEWVEELSSSGAGGVQFAEVEVDTETGFVKVKKILVVQDCGAHGELASAESQVNGGVITGLGYALY